MIIQIYAFTRLEQAVEAAEIGVDQIGFVAGDYNLVPGELSFRDARLMADAIRGKAASTALTMATEVDEILHMAEAVRPDIIHISTDPEDVSLAKMMELRQRLPPEICLMKAVHGNAVNAESICVKFETSSDIILLDTKVTGMPGVGATGRTHDWEVSRRIVELLKTPVILAGGLKPENVVEAIQTVHPWGVDSNTWTNVPGDPVAKDMRLVRDFVQAIRSAENGI